MVSNVRKKMCTMKSKVHLRVSNSQVKERQAVEGQATVHKEPEIDLK